MKVKIGNMVKVDGCDWRIIEDCGDGWVRLRRPGCVGTMAMEKSLIIKCNGVITVEG